MATQFETCAWSGCRAPVPSGSAPACPVHADRVEHGACVDGENGGRRFVPSSDPECAEALGEPLLRPRRAIRVGLRVVHEWGPW